MNTNLFAPLLCYHLLGGEYNRVYLVSGGVVVLVVVVVGGSRVEFRPNTVV